MSKRPRARTAASTQAAVASKEPAPHAAPVDVDLSTWSWDHAFLTLLMLVPVLLNAVMLLPELTIPVPASNDLAVHWQMVRGASDAMAQGRNPLDFWMPQLELGYPQFLYYQNLPHLLLAAVHRLLLGAVDLRTLFNGSRYLLMVALPLTVYWSMRRLDFSVRSAAISAAAASLVSSKEGFGLEYEGHVWLGHGLFAQLWAEHLSFVVLACLYRVMRTGRGYIAAVLAFTALALTHFIWAYMMAMTGVIMWMLISDRRTLLANAVRLGTVGLLAIAGSSYMLVPFAQSSGKYLASLPGIKYSTFDPLTPIMSTISGTLMDAGRWPVLTVLAALGMVAALWRRNRTTRFALVGTCIWIVLYQVRPNDVTILGRILRYDGNLIFRFVGVLEMFALMLIGLGGEWLWQAIADARRPFMRSAVTRSEPGDERVATARLPLFAPLLACVALMVVLAPALKNRFDYFGLDGRSIVRTARALEADKDLRTVLDTIEAQSGGGRAYIGLANNWGKQLRVGPLLRGYDVLKFSRLPAVVPPYQGLSLNANSVVAFRDGDPSQYDLLDVRYAIAPATATSPPFLRPLFRTNSYVLYTAQTTGIAMFGGVVERRAVASQVDLIDAYDAWAKSNGPATRRFIRWDFKEPPGPPAPTSVCPDGGRTLAERVEAGVINVEVECPIASTLVLKTTYHPNWRVTVDGRSTPAYMVSPVYIALDLPAGRHTVVARYLMAPGKWQLLVAGLIVLVLAIVFRRYLDWLPTRLTTLA